MERSVEKGKGKKARRVRSFGVWRKGWFLLSTMAGGDDDIDAAGVAGDEMARPPYRACIVSVILFLLRRLFVVDLSTTSRGPMIVCG